MKITIISIILLLLITIQPKCQETIFIAGYSPAISFGNTSSFMGQNSWRGVNFESRYFLNALLTVGASFGWQVYSKKLPDYTQYFENGFFYGNQYRHINAYPMFITCHYHLYPEKYFRPFFGGGVGMVYLNQRTDMGLYSSSVKSWNIGLSPEIGILYDFSNSLNALVAVNFNHAFKSDKSDGYTALNFKIALVWVGF